MQQFNQFFADNTEDENKKQVNQTEFDNKQLKMLKDCYLCKNQK